MVGRDYRFGEYVTYTPSLSEYIVMPEDSGCKEQQVFHPSENTLWRIYDNDEGFLQLISVRSIGSVTLGGQIGYAKAVATLNRLCNAYGNPLYTAEGRCLGSTERCVPELDLSTCTAKWLKQSADGKIVFPHHETEYNEDIAWLRCSKLMNRSDRFVWLASRQAELTGIFNMALFSVSVWNGMRDERQEVCLYRGYQDGEGYGYEATYGVRPVQVLKSGVRLRGGDGSREKPYQLVA